MIRFGPAGLGSVKDAKATLESYAKQGLRACELAFTYGIYIKNKKDAEEIGALAKKLDIKLSIHAQYWINLNSMEKKKIEQSKKRILDCLAIGTQLGAYAVVFHPGYYGKMSKEETYEHIKKAIQEIKNEADKKKYTPLICPETMGKVNVFGSLDEVLQLVKDTGCACCVDVAHLLARNKKVDYAEVFARLKNIKIIHMHFSGIEYGEKGEKRHLITPKENMLALVKVLPENKDVTIINESPAMIEDSVATLKTYQKIRK